jgi:hypothetical protein
MRRIALLLVGFAFACLSSTVWAHGVNERDKAFI